MPVENEVFEFEVAASHPSIDGHFPGQPIVPGVVTLQIILDWLSSQLDGVRITGIKKMKFIQAQLPEQLVVLSYTVMRQGSIRVAGARKSTGQVMFEAVMEVEAVE